MHRKPEKLLRNGAIFLTDEMFKLKRKTLQMVVGFTIAPE